MQKKYAQYHIKNAIQFMHVLPRRYPKSHVSNAMASSGVPSCAYSTLRKVNSEDLADVRRDQNLRITNTTPYTQYTGTIYSPLFAEGFGAPDVGEKQSPPDC
jgi:hypothetical protein